MNRETSEAKGIMYSIIGLDFGTVEFILRQYKDLGVVSIVNHNAKYQIAVSGHVRVIDKAIKMLKLKSARIISLNISGAWDTELMRGMTAEFENFLNTIQFKTPKCKIIHNVNCETTKNPYNIKAFLVEQICKPVLWFDSMNKLINEGVDIFIKIRLGKVLNNLLKKTLPKNFICKIFNINDIRMLDKFLT